MSGAYIDSRCMPYIFEHSEMDSDSQNRISITCRPGTINIYRKEYLGLTDTLSQRGGTAGHSMETSRKLRSIYVYHLFSSLHPLPTPCCAGSVTTPAILILTLGCLLLKKGKTCAVNEIYRCLQVMLLHCINNLALRGMIEKLQTPRG